jgi:hypothetical protein
MPFLRAVHAESSVLAGAKVESSVGLNANHPEVGSKIRPLGYFDPVKFIVTTGHKGLIRIADELGLGASESVYRKWGKLLEVPVIQTTEECW